MWWGNHLIPSWRKLWSRRKWRTIAWGRFWKRFKKDIYFRGGCCAPAASVSAWRKNKRRSVMAKIIGIDLGTSNSAAAVMEGGKPTIIPSAEGTTLGGKAFPSYVAITKDNQLLVGEPARRQAVSN